MSIHINYSRDHAIAGRSAISVCRGQHSAADAIYLDGSITWWEFLILTSQYIFSLTIIVVPVAHWFAFMLAATTSLLAVIAYVQAAIAQIHDLSPPDPSFAKQKDRAFSATLMVDPSSH